MKKIGIHGLPVKPSSKEAVHLLLQELRQREKDVIFSSAFRRENQDMLDLSSDVAEYPDNLNAGDVDCLFSLGGDGTLLDTLTHIGSAELPILGINHGRLGFLATTSKDEISNTLDAFFAGDFDLEKRSLVELQTSSGYFGENNFALNEFAMLRTETSAMIAVKCYLNEEYLNTYWADGLMVSTPTGSTGYSLSCGGPIIMPGTKNFIVTPVSPHNLNIRPLIIPDDNELRFKIESRDTKFLISLDSRSDVASHDEEMWVKRADFSACLIKMKGSSFIDTLRNKLNWGFDKRN